LQAKTAALSEIALFAALSEAEIQVLAREGEPCAGIFSDRSGKRENLPDISQWTRGDAGD
jgi:hypothetical protein